VRKAPKKLPARLKRKKRYVAFFVFTDSRLSESDVVSAVHHSIMELFGETGLSTAGFSLVEYQNGCGIMKCNLDFLDKFKFSLAFIERIGDARVSFIVLGVSGTIKSARRKFIKRFLERGIQEKLERIRCPR